MSKLPIKSLLAAALSAAALQPLPAAACGGDSPFVGEICTFAFNFCPQGYEQANGQLLLIAQHEVLFALYGTTFGGDGQQTFALPDLQGRAALGNGQGPGLSNIVLGQLGGTEFVSLGLNQLPAHTHAATTVVTVTALLNAVSSTGNTSSPVGKALAVSAARDNLYSDAAPAAAMASGAVTADAGAVSLIGAAGGSQSFPIRSPYLGLRKCVSLEGIFPSRN